MQSARGWPVLLMLGQAPALLALVALPEVNRAVLCALSGGRANYSNVAALTGLEARDARTALHRFLVALRDELSRTRRPERRPATGPRCQRTCLTVRADTRRHACQPGSTPWATRLPAEP